MLGSEKIEQIRHLKSKGKSYREIAEILDVSTWSIQKYWRVPGTSSLLGEMETLKEIVENLISRVKALEEIKPDVEQVRNKINNIKQYTKEPEKDDPDPVGKYTTAKELAKNPGFYAERTIQKHCEKSKYEKDLSTKGKPYLIPIEDSEKFRKPVKC